MSDTDADSERTDLDGLPVEKAADVVEDTEATAGEMRETLGIVARDGVVRRAAVDDAVSNASMVVTTAETRTELAAEKLDGVREAAEPVSDLDLVSVRVDEFGDRLDAIERRTGDLGDAVQEVLGMRDDGDLYAIARRIRRVTSASTGVQRAADDLQSELDSFEAWLADADRRGEELTADVDALAESVDELDAAVDALAADDDEAEAEAVQKSVAAMVQHRVASLMIADLRAELAALRTWAEREGEASPPDVSDRLDEIRRRHEAVGDRLAARADADETARVADELTALEDALDAMEPPVAWGEVEAVVEEHRPAVE